MRLISAWIKANRKDPVPSRSCILPRRYVWPVMEAAGEKVSASKHLRPANLTSDGISGVLRNFEPNRPLDLALDEVHPLADAVTDDNIRNLQTRSQPRSLLSIARFKSERSLRLPASSRVGASV